MGTTMVTVHSHVLYLELTKQATIYIQMANIPVEYTQYIVDGALIIFAFSSSVMVGMILGMLCDCCCPKMPKQPSESHPKPAGDKKTSPPQKPKAVPIYI